MNYLPRNRSRKPYGKRALGLLLLFATLALVFSLLDGVIVSAISPIWRAENALTRGFKSTLENWRSKQSLIEENQLLKERLNSLELSGSSPELLRERERVIAGLLGQRFDEPQLYAAVLTTPPQSPYDLIVIDAGEKDGLALGAKVSLPEGPILGTVTDLFPSSAKVKLFSTSGERTQAVLERHNVPVMLEGQSGGNFRIEVPRDVAVERGDRILSPSLEGALLAVVEAVVVEPTDSFKEILAKSPTNIFSVRFVVASP